MQLQWDSYLAYWFLVAKMSRPDNQTTKSSFHRVYTGVLDLVLIRAKLFSIEVAEHREALITKIILLCTILVFLLLGFLTLLFALNALLPDLVKVWVFFSFCAFFLIASLLLFWKVTLLSKKHITPFATTLNELKKDLQALQGKEDEE